MNSFHSLNNEPVDRYYDFVIDMKFIMHYFEMGSVVVNWSFLR